MVNTNYRNDRLEEEIALICSVYWYIILGPVYWVLLAD